MSTVNQASLRDEFARLKGEYGALSAAGKVPAETGVLMSAVFVLLELMVAIFLEKTTKKGSANSSIPSSQNTTPDDSAADTAPGTKSKGSGGQGQRFAGSRTVETETVSPVTTCGCCGQDLVRGRARWPRAAHPHRHRSRSRHCSWLTARSGPRCPSGRSTLRPAGALPAALDPRARCC